MPPLDIDKYFLPCYPWRSFHPMIQWYYIGTPQGLFVLL